MKLDEGVDRIGNFQKRDFPNLKLENLIFKKYFYVFFRSRCRLIPMPEYRSARPRCAIRTVTELPAARGVSYIGNTAALGAAGKIVCHFFFAMWHLILQAGVPPRPQTR